MATMSDITADRIAAELTAVRERNEHGDLREFAFRDAPRLIAAIERVLRLAAGHEHGALRWADPLPVPPWIPQLRVAIAAELLDETDQPPVNPRCLRCSGRNPNMCSCVERCGHEHCAGLGTEAPGG